MNIALINANPELMGAGRPQPCEVCRRVHQGRCASNEQRSVTFNVSLPGYLHRDLVEAVPWGERSAFVAEALQQALAHQRRRQPKARIAEHRGLHVPGAT